MNRKFPITHTLIMAALALSALPTQAQDITLIPTKCVLEHYRDGALVKRYEGRCGYNRPLLVSPDGSFPSAEPEPQGIRSPAPPLPPPGLHAVLQIGRDIVPETASQATPMALSYKFISSDGKTSTVRASKFTGLVKPGLLEAVSNTAAPPERGTDELRFGYILISPR